MREETRLKTKEKIIQTAITAFNREGYTAISLFEIAQLMGISRGNLTYHFKDKEELLQAITAQMWQKIKQERLVSRQSPTFENLHKEVQLYYRFQKEYAFIFLDTHVLNHPFIQEEFREMTQQTIQDNMGALAFAVAVGNIKPEPAKGVYYNIAFTTWMLTFYWLSQQIIRGEAKEEEGEKMIWNLLLPYFTEKGLNTFKKYFGENYFESALKMAF
jgi:AcrR family transcriptional regulator